MSASHARAGSLLFLLALIAIIAGCSGPSIGGKAGTWDVYAISLSFSGPKDYDLTKAGISSSFELHADGTGSYSLSQPGYVAWWTGTWEYSAGRYTLYRSDGWETVVFSEYGADLYWVGQTSGGKHCWLWYRRR